MYAILVTEPALSGPGHFTAPVPRLCHGVTGQAVLVYAILVGPIGRGVSCRLPSPRSHIQPASSPFLCLWSGNGKVGVGGGGGEFVQQEKERREGEEHLILNFKYRV